jgi:hypothetical protein
MAGATENRLMLDNYNVQRQPKTDNNIAVIGMSCDLMTIAENNWT